MNAIFRTLSPALVSALLLSGCGSPGAGSVTPVSSARASALFTIRWASATQSQVRKPAFVSPSAKSIRVDVLPNGSTDLSQQLTTIVNNTGTPTSAVSVDAPVGNDSFTFSVYDAQNALGTKIGGGQVTQTIVAGTGNVVKATLSGYLASVAIATTDPLFVKTPQISSGLPVYAVVGVLPVTFSVTPLDADQNVILTGAPVISVSADSPAYAVSPVSGSANGYTIQYVAQSAPLTPPHLVIASPGSQTAFSASYALTARGLLYAAAGTGAAAHVYAYDSNGNQWPTGAFSGVQMPIGMTYDPVNQRVYVADRGTGTILAFDARGSVAQGWTPPAVPSITGVTYSRSTNHVLATSSAGTGTVYVFDKSGTPVASTGFTGLHAPPVGIASGTDDRFVAVVEQGTPSYVDVFSPTGTYYPAYSTALKTIYGAPFTATEITDGGARPIFSDDYFWIGGSTSQGSEAAIFDPAYRAGSSTIPFFFAGEGAYAVPDIAVDYRGGYINTPLSSSFDSGSGLLWIANGVGSLSAWTCGGPYCTSAYPWRPSVIPPPSGASNFTAVATVHN